MCRHASRAPPSAQRVGVCVSVCVVYTGMKMKVGRCLIEDDSDGNDGNDGINDDGRRNDG